MSKVVQFGYHPDADQISAFVEQALPAHEREQLLYHLAVCPGCRDLVALSLPEVPVGPEVEVTEQPLPAIARKPWWPGWNRGWTVAWTFAGALAAAALFLVYIRHVTTVPGAPDQQQVAVAPSAAPPISQEQRLPSAAKPAQQGSQPATGRQAASAGSATVAPKPNQETAGTGQTMGEPIQTDRSLDALRKPAEARATVPAGSSTPGASLAGGLGRGFSSGAAGGFAKAPSADTEARLKEAAPTPAAPASNPPARRAAATAPMPAATATVVANSNAPMDTDSSDSANFSIAENELQTMPLGRSLPSHLPVLSMVAQARRMVAIDTGHAVFASKDAGKHWKAIRTPWQGRAMKTALVEYGAGRAAASSFLNMAIAGKASANDEALEKKTNGALVAQSPLPAAAKDSSLTGTVTDQVGATIPGASLTVTETTTGAARTVKTDGAGRYIVDGLAPGNYRVEAQAAGFEKQQLSSVAVADSGASIANLSLRVGASTEEVSVSAASVPLSDDAKKNKKPAAPNHPAPVFEILTDNGERWTSTDGVTWKQM